MVPAVALPICSTGDFVMEIRFSTGASASRICHTPRPKVLTVSMSPNELFVAGV